MGRILILSDEFVLTSHSKPWLLLGFLLALNVVQILVNKFLSSDFIYNDSKDTFGQILSRQLIQINLEVRCMESFGEHVRSLRVKKGLPLRKVAALLDIDASTLSKIERGERSANKEMIPLLAEIFDRKEEELGVILLSDRVASQLYQIENHEQVLKVANLKVKQHKNKRT